MVDSCQFQIIPFVSVIEVKAIFYTVFNIVKTRNVNKFHRLKINAIIFVNFDIESEGVILQIHLQIRKERSP